MTIPDCQPDYVWNEPQSRTGEHTCVQILRLEDKDLTKILAWRSWGFVAQDSLGKVVHSFNARRSLSSRSARDKASSRFRLLYTPSIWATPSAGGLYIRTLDSLLFACLHLLTSTSVGASSGFQLKQVASVGPCLVCELSDYDLLDFPFIAAHCCVSWTWGCKSLNSPHRQTIRPVTPENPD